MDEQKDRWRRRMDEQTDRRTNQMLGNKSVGNYCLLGLGPDEDIFSKLRKEEIFFFNENFKVFNLNLSRKVLIGILFTSH